MGFYDRLLPQLNATKIALAYDFQIVDSFEPEVHDVPMDIIITDKGIINCK